MATTKTTQQLANELTILDATMAVHQVNFGGKSATFVENGERFVKLTRTQIENAIDFLLAGGATLTKSEARRAAQIEAKQAEAKPGCGCGCGEQLKGNGSKFVQGHDARFYGMIKRVMEGRLDPKQATPQVLIAVENGIHGHGVFAPRIAA